MKHGRKLRNALILLCFFIWPIVSHAEETRSFQVGLFHPVQIFPDDYSVNGFRLNIIYGVNEDMQGLDLGVFNEVKRDFKGVQLGLIANVTGRSFEGFQAAVFYNDAEEEMQGLQLGIINHTGSLEGIQIGIINFNDEEKYLGFFPFINASF